MARLIQTFADGSKLEFDQGKFDEWCIFYTSADQSRYAPHDVEYFQDLKEMGKKYSGNLIYDDFTEVFQQTTSALNNDTLRFIKKLSQKYKPDQLRLEKLFTILYAGMLAEENKANKKLGKRIKHLGVYQVLIDELPIHTAANYSRGKNWRLLDETCKNLGF